MGVSPQSWAEFAESYYKAEHIEKAEEILTKYFDVQITKVDKYL